MQIGWLSEYMYNGDIKIWGYREYKNFPFSYMLNNQLYSCIKILEDAHLCKTREMRLKAAVPDSQTGLFGFESVNLFLSTSVYVESVER